MSVRTTDTKPESKSDSKTSTTAAPVEVLKTAKPAAGSTTANMTVGAAKKTTDDKKNDEKSKALDLAVSAIEKQFGKGSIMRLGTNDSLYKDIPAISTGSISSTMSSSDVKCAPSWLRLPGSSERWKSVPKIDGSMEAQSCLQQ